MTPCIYTDLANEARELHPKLPGVSEESERSGGVAVTRIRVETPEAAKALQKPMGRYVTLDVPSLAERPLSLFADVSRALSVELQSLFSPLPPDAAVLVIGLGNRLVTPDALGPRTIEQVYVTRHIAQYLPDAFPSPVRAVCAIAPGVLGVTGIETLEAVRGIVEHVKPALLIVIDALASRRTERISAAIQLTDAGIQPGGGVGNARMEITPESFGIPVIALGVPTVVYASTIAQDTLSSLASKLGFSNEEDALRELAAKATQESFGSLIVTPKDIDSLITDMSRVVADGVNMALFGASFELVRELVA